MHGCAMRKKVRSRISRIMGPCCANPHDEGMSWLALPLDIRPPVRGQLILRDVVETIGGWLSKCQDDHLDCLDANDGSSLRLPARLLDIGTTADCPTRVVTIQPEQTVKYIALSYCWGKAKFLKLTSATLEVFSHDIDWDDLPETWQDAINVAFDLEVRYLWIDALCIIQDSPDDWATESSKMGEIYQGASIVISAEKAENADAGFLDDWLDSPPPSKIVDLPLDLRPAQPDLVLTTCKQSERSAPKDVMHDVFWAPEDLFISELSQRERKTREDKNPMLHRGWCLQERYLATRIVHFTSSEMFWECRQRTCCECGFSPRAQRPRKRLFHQHQQGNEQRTEENVANMRTKSPDPWWNLLHEFVSTPPQMLFKSLSIPSTRGLSRSPWAGYMNLCITA